MPTSQKRSEIAAAKRDLVRRVLIDGGTNAQAFREVRREFRTGIASRDLIRIAREVRARPTPMEETFATPPAGSPAPIPSVRRVLMVVGDVTVAEGVQFSDGATVFHWVKPCPMGATTTVRMVD